MQDIDRHWKDLFSWERIIQTIYIPSKIHGKSHFKEYVRDIWTVDIGTIGWDFWSVSNQLGNFNMETEISGQRGRSHQSPACKGLRILRFCVVSYRSGTTVGMVWRFITIQNIGHNRRRTDGIRVEYFPRILNIGACPRSPKVHEQYGQTPTIPRTNYLREYVRGISLAWSSHHNASPKNECGRQRYLHVDVQWHHGVKWRQWNGMYC